MTRGAGLLTRVTALILAGSLVFGGCARLPRRFGYGFAGLRSRGLNLGQISGGGNLSPVAGALLAVASPLAREGLKALAAAWSRYVAERREADARAEEARRKQIAEAQIFYAEQCTTRAVGPAGQVNADAEGDEERRAEAAFAAGDFTGTVTLLEAVFAAKKEALGEEHPETARVINKLAVAQSAAGHPADAFVLASHGHDLRARILAEAEKKKAFGSVMHASLDVAESETTLALVLQSGGEYRESLPYLQHALDVRTKYLGEDHLCVAQSQTSLGELEQAMDAYGRAKALYLKALATREKRLPEGHRDRARSYDDLGSLYRDIAIYDQAKDYDERALASRRALGEDHPELADSYQQLGALHRAMGDFAQAEAFYEKALAIRRARFKDGLPVADTETSLAQLYASFGDDGRAEALLEHAYGIRKARLPADHPDLAESLSELGRVEQAKREYAEAERNDRAALAIWEKKFGEKHLAVARGAMALGELYLAQGRLDAAKASFAKARDVREKALGGDHPDTAEAIQRLGEVAYAGRDYARAEPLFRTAAEIREKRLGAKHPSVTASLSYLAALLAATGRPDEALQTFRRAQVVTEAFLGSVGAMASEARFDAILRMLRAQEEVVYSLLLDPRLAPRAAPLALSVALLRKGRSVDEAASISRSIYMGLKGDQREEFDQLRALRAQLASQELSSAGGESPQDAKQLEDRAERLEADLAQHSAAIRARRDAPRVDDVVKRVAAALPARAMLVEVVKYHAYRLEPGRGQPRWGGLRYAAMVLDGRGTVRSADLGPASPVDEQVKAFLHAITHSGSGARAQEADVAVKEIGQELYTRVMRPIEPFLAGNERIVLSLDGQLNLVPFCALFDGRRYVIDEHELSYVTSGRDLLPRPGVKPSHEVALLAKPTFVKDPAGLRHQDRPADRGLVLVEGAGALDSLTHLAPGALRLTSPPSPLPGTAREAMAIHALIPGSKVVMGSRATKQYFLGLQAPGILHVATHGLFRREDAERRASARGLETRGDLLAPIAATTRRTEPLLDSMLLWANVGTPWKGDGAAVVLEPAGLATALEVAGMNLWGTQLVVLSACETGRGQVDALGQGVYGLRRAVMVAGAETLVTSLWKVDDQVTSDLMTAYYRRLLAGAGRAEALRQASLMVRKKHPEPVDWAPFLAIGQVGPVQGIR